jgi:hypothetical protein
VGTRDGRTQSARACKDLGFGSEDLGSIWLWGPGFQDLNIWLSEPGFWLSRPGFQDLDIWLSGPRFQDLDIWLSRPGFQDLDIWLSGPETSYGHRPLLGPVFFPSLFSASIFLCVTFFCVQWSQTDRQTHATSDFIYKIWILDSI